MTEAVRAHVRAFVSVGAIASASSSVFLSTLCAEVIFVGLGMHHVCVCVLEYAAVNGPMCTSVCECVKTHWIVFFVQGK